MIDVEVSNKTWRSGNQAYTYVNARHSCQLPLMWGDENADQRSGYPRGSTGTSPGREPDTHDGHPGSE
jgi:hypothetical protein